MTLLAVILVELLPKLPPGLPGIAIWWVCGWAVIVALGLLTIAVSLRFTRRMEVRRRAEGEPYSTGA